MNGDQRREDSWPRPILTNPRTARELLWHATLLTGPATLLLPGGWYLLLCVSLTTRLLRPRPGQVATVAAAYLLAGATYLTLRDGPGSYQQHLLTFLNHRVPDGVTLLQFTGWMLLLLPFPLLTYALYQAYDRRAVVRGTVDERLWTRQQQRRRQLAFAAHVSDPPPLVG